jgi:GT2 family glycosyltransferase
MPDNAVPDLSIIIVSWNVRDLLRACLASIQDAPRIGLSNGSGPHIPGAGPALPGVLTTEIFVVDNASTDSSAEMVGREFPWVKLTANAENRGFTGGNNQALRQSSGRYVFFLNCDTRVVGDALGVMVDYLETHPAVGALGPQLRYPDGCLQSSRRRFPTFGTALFESTPLAWHWLDNPWARRYHMVDMPDDQAQPVDWVMGAAILARRALLQQIGGFDEQYFMYSEELDWCRRASDAGWTIVYLPDAQIIHYEGKSSEQAVAARHIRFQMSKLRYFRKYHGAPVAEALRGFLLACFAIESAIEGLKWLAGSKRPLRRNRLAAYRQLLSTGLRTAG